jgi:hypothetical protein
MKPQKGFATTLIIITNFLYNGNYWHMDKCLGFKHKVTMLLKHQTQNLKVATLWNLHMRHTFFLTTLVLLTINNISCTTFTLLVKILLLIVTIA